MVSRKRFPVCIAPVSSESEVVSMDQLESKVLRALNCKRGIWFFKRLAVGIFLVGPLVCIALFGLTLRLLPGLRRALFTSVIWFRMLAIATRKRVSSFLHFHATKYSKTPRDGHRIPGLNGLLCTGQPASSTAITRTASAETYFLRLRLVVASFAAVAVGVLAAAMTPDAHKQPTEILSTILVHSDEVALSPPAVSSHPREPEASEAKRASGFAVLASTPMVELASLPGMTIADMMAIACPLTVAVQTGATTETLEVTLPIRKPKLKAKPRRRTTTPKHQLTVWEQLPWLH